MTEMLDERRKRRGEIKSEEGRIGKVTPVRLKKRSANLVFRPSSLSLTVRRRTRTIGRREGQRGNLRCYTDVSTVGLSAYGTQGRYETTSSLDLTDSPFSHFDRVLDVTAPLEGIIVLGLECAAQCIAKDRKQRKSFGGSYGRVWLSYLALLQV
jgi:hypothetical protein